MCLNIVTREAWYALKPKIFQNKLNLARNHVFWMNVKISECNDKVHCINLVNSNQRFSIFSKNLRDIRYNFVIGGDGNVYECRGWGTDPLLPKRAENLSDQSLLVGFLGFFTMDTLPAKMKDIGYKLVKYGVHSGHIAKDYCLHDLMNPKDGREGAETWM